MRVAKLAAAGKGGSEKMQPALLKYLVNKPLINPGDVSVFSFLGIVPLRRGKCF